MLQGTGSDVGKSLLAAGLGRAYTRRGLAVRPFKPQNMSNNAAVTADGGEIGRAQALQARACGVAPSVHMNPVLLKPQTEVGAQVVVQGRVRGNAGARDYQALKAELMPAVLDSLARICEGADLVLVEGAGSPAEVNLRAGDIANMGFAEAADCPVILVADIDRGGALAHITGTLDLLAETERSRVAGCVINRFRGDLSLLQPGLEWLEHRTGTPVLGVLPYLDGLHLEAEDALTREAVEPRGDDALRVVVPALPRISNHTDLDPLRLHPQVALRVVGPGQPAPPGDLIVLPGSKSVRADLEWLRRHGWETPIRRHLRYGGKVIGLCGGFQMLGRRIADPHGLEGDAGASEGLGVLDIETALAPDKTLRNVRGRLALEDAPVTGYEIHAGVTGGAALERAAVRLDDGRAEGALSEDRRVLGTYLHGLFESPPALAALLRWAGLAAPEPLDYGARRAAGIERLADAVEAHLAHPVLERLLAR